MTRRALRDERFKPLLSARRPLLRLAAMLLQCIFAEGVAADERDPFLALATHAEGIVNYVRASEVQALVDLNQSKCLLVLLSGEEMRAYQKCASIAGDPKQYGFVSFTSPFGNVFAIPAAISSLRSTSSSGCSLALRNARFVPVSESCVAAHKALVGE
ncbi:hypothetical protein RZS28_01830 [Methylocapsa polymorpha]|uniref:Uncharacterized protein n=1 Tax=Methylocapsa polymorpha TaxID=3080828 RepID=A0ABZ0HRY9_9HYPH|nr:hypothetical protein RZS28_01830 [Methylocapsa sp. RX1]